MKDSLRKDAEISIDLPARAENVGLARHAVGGIAEAHGWGDAFAADMMIVVSEACTNAVLHGYPNKEPGSLHLRCWIDPGVLRLRISDDGSGIDPKLRSEASGLGLGLPLMLALCDEVTVRTRSQGPTQVDVVFATPPASGR